MKASDIAYMASLVEKAPSNYPGRKDLLDELQRIYIEAHGGKLGMSYNVPVTPSLSMGSVMRVDRG